MTINSQKITATIAGKIPASVKVVLRGRSSSPRWVATAIHKLLNRVPGDRYPVLDCRGPLEGYRIKVDWQKHRSFAYGTWEPEVVNAVAPLSTSGMVAIDVGAHGGFFALLLAKLVGPAGKVVAFEPLPANFRILELNIGINALHNVIAEPLAASDRSGELRFEVPPEDSSLLAGPLASTDERGALTVACIALDEYCAAKQLRPGFIKIDVEGAETDVLKGAARIIQEFHPSMMIELHEFGNVEDHPIIVRLRAMGYAIQWLGEIKYTAHFLARWAGS